MRRPVSFVLPLIVLLAAACDSAERIPRARAEPAALPVDSAMAADEALRRFRAGLPRPTGFGEGAAPSRDALVSAFAAALERADTAALARLALDRAEFAWLYYPDAPVSRAPYELPPELAWFQLQGHNDKGLARALGRYGGKPSGFRGYSCEGEERQGPNRLWTRCVVRTSSGDASLFGAIVERGGRYKLVSFENAL